MANIYSNKTGLQNVLDALSSKASPSTSQATPVISVNASGLITATAGTKKATKQLAFAPAATITPGTSVKTAVSSGYYTGGDIKVAGDSNLKASNIKSGVTIFGVTGTLANSGGSSGIETAFTYTVNPISGAKYGFALNDDGYYESQNQGQNYSYAICRVTLQVNTVTDVIFDVINYAESNFDYAIFGNLDTALGLNYQTDTNAKENFKGRQSDSVVNVTYSSVPTGSHFIDIKFVKDQSQHSNYDSVQFKIQPGVVISDDLLEQLLEAEPDLVASNIKDGVNILGITGTYGNANTMYEDIFTKNLPSNYTNSTLTTIPPGGFCCAPVVIASFPNASSIGDFGFYGCDALSSVNASQCTYVGHSAFADCYNLTSVSMPKLKSAVSYAFAWAGLKKLYFPSMTQVGYYAFGGNEKLSQAYLSAAKTVSGYAFAYCDTLSYIEFGPLSYISNSAFISCYNLSEIYISGSSVCTLYNSDVFKSTPYRGYSSSFSGSPKIYVPSSLVTSYKAATGWSYFSSYIIGTNIGVG